MERYIDLHTHTVYSDGLYTPEILVRALALNGIEVFSKTDHDTLAGYEETVREADKWGIISVPGIEFSTHNYHILGYGFNVTDGFLEVVDYSRELQRQNCRKRVEVLADYGVPISLEKVQRNFPNSRLGKMNVFMTMLTDEGCRGYLLKKHGKIIPEEVKAFYFGKGTVLRSDYGSEDLSSHEAISAIHSAGGIAVLAHPGRDVKSMDELEVLLEQGIDGLEIQPNFYENYAVYEAYANENSLLLTYGSDYHGPYMKRGFLGRGMNFLRQNLEERILCFAN